MKKYAIIDFLKGYSIFTIVLMHLVGGISIGIVSKAVAFGGAGVHVFILCSGFGLYLSYLKNPLTYKEFLKRRFGKIYTPYAIVVLLWGAWLLETKRTFPIREIASHLFLYKMFSFELDTSLCYFYWFISTIIQFYLFYPLIIKVFRLKSGACILLMISLLWSIIVGILGLEDKRPWSSFFLQYLWEFGLGMWIAKRVFLEKSEDMKLMDIHSYSWLWLLIGAVSGMGLSALMAWNSGILKLYNDIPSMIGYLSVALMIYKSGINILNQFFKCTNAFSYELYLVHGLVYVVMITILTSRIPIAILLIISFLSAYLIAYAYKWILQKIKLIR